MTWEFGPYHLDEQLFELRRSGVRVALRPLALRCLLALARNSSRAVASAELHNTLWPGVTVAGGSLRQVIRSLRRSLGPDGARHVVRVRGYGYRLSGAVHLAPGPPPPSTAAPVIDGAARRPEGGRPFAGRSQELRDLLDAADRARAGKGQVVLVTGPPGVGKTRLAEELTAQIPPDMRAVWGRCWEDGGSPPLWPWDEILRSTLERDEVPGPDLDALRLEPGGAPVAAGLARASEDPHARFRLFAAFAALLRRRAEAAPLLIVIDDLHAAEEPALLLLKFVARELAGCRALIVATYRAEAMQARPRCAEILDRVASAGFTVALGGLDADAVRTCLESATRRTVSPTVVTAVRDLTGGNPLFLHELIRTFGDRVADGTCDLAGLGRSATPIRDAIRDHLRPASPRARDVMAAAAILGSEIELVVLTEMLSWPADDIAGACEELVKVGVMKPVRPGCVRFAHTLIRDLVDDELSPSVRRDLHGKAADALERLGRGTHPRSIAIIAHHLLACLPGADVARRAIDRLAGAAAAATSAMAHEEARRYCRTALDLLEQSGEADRRWFDLTVSLVDAERLCGAFASSHTAALGAIAWARARGSAEDLAEAVCACARAQPETGAIDHTLMAAFEDALARLPEQPSALRARLQARLAVLLSFCVDDRRCVELSAQALADARAVGDVRTVGYALSSRIFCLIGVPGVDARRALGEVQDEALAVSRVCDDADVALELLAWSHVTMLNRGLVERAREQLLRFEQLCRTARRPLHEWHLRSTRAARAIWEGDFAAAEALAVEAHDYGTQVEAPYAASVLGGQFFQIRRDQGRLGELLPVLQGQAAAFPTMAVWRGGLAVAHLEVGDADAARAELERVASRELAHLAHDVNWLPTITLFSIVSSGLEERASCARLYRLLQPMEEGLVTTGAVAVVLGVVSETLGQLAMACGDARAAVDHFRSALDLTRRLGALPWMGRALLGLAGALLRHPASPSVRKEALASARQARAIAQRLQMRPTLERADAMLVEARARADERPRAGAGERSRGEA